MRKVLLLTAFLLCSAVGFAAHIVGGEMIYEHVSTNTGGTKTYRITLRLFRDELCPPPCAPMPLNVYIGIFNNDNLQQFVYSGDQPHFDVAQTSEEPIAVDEVPDCITKAPDLNYHVATYVFTVTLPPNKKGYTAAYQTCCRVSSLENVDNPPGGNTGSTYNCIIPGTDNLPTTQKNNSPKFKLGVAVICQNKPFTLSFSATDTNADSLVYSFCDAYGSGPVNGSNNVNPAPPKGAVPEQYGPVPYINDYSGTTPLGGGVTINPKTGVISGVGPTEGRYVVCVCISEYRKGVLIGYHRKDFIVNVSDCEFAAAKLLPSYITCDGLSYTFQNQSAPSPLIHTYFWDFGDGRTSTDAIPTHNYLDSGVYNLKLVINRGEECRDSSYSKISVYPGFAADFSYVPCKNDPTAFIDQTTSVYGSVNSWQWNLGDETSFKDTSRAQHPFYTYPTTGKKNVQLVVTNTKGCADTLAKEINIVAKAFAGRDTAIVAKQNLQLQATGGDFYSWSPITGLSDPNIANPVLSYTGAADSLRYRVQVSTLDGCIDTASLMVKIFKTEPQVFVPTGFTPNNDGRNDVVRPIAVGMEKMEYFRIYNRWGQLVFSTTENGKAWDGKVAGKEQGMNVFVWIVKGIDYLGNSFFAKGTITLIR